MVELASFTKAFWSYLIDESTDKSITEELILYMCYVDLDKACVLIKLLSVSSQCRNNNDTSVFQEYKLLTDLLVARTSDGA